MSRSIPFSPFRDEVVVLLVFGGVWQWRSFQASIVHDQYLDNVGEVQTGKGLMVREEWSVHW